MQAHCKHRYPWLNRWHETHRSLFGTSFDRAGKMAVMMVAQNGSILRCITSTLARLDACGHVQTLARLMNS